MIESARGAAVNWAGNLTYGAREVLRPRTLDEAADLVASAAKPKALGSRHSFNTVADTPGGTHLDLSALAPVFSLDAAARTVTVSASARYGDLVTRLDASGFALENLASLPHITVAGSVATGTHGSGERHQGLASAVSSLTLLTADGTVLSLSRGDADFAGAVVGVGALGVVTSLTLDVVPTFSMRQDVYDNLPWTSALTHFDEIQAAGYSVSLFTNWARDVVDQVWLKNVVAPSAPSSPGDAISGPSGAGPTEIPASLFGAVPADGPRHPAHTAGVPAGNTTPQLGEPGPWYDRLPHFRLGFTPSVGAELQTEYFVPRSAAPAAFEALRALGHRIAPLLLVSEIRTIAADDLWLSPAHGRDSVALHFTWLPRQPEVEALLPTLEAALAPFAPRPHWGKLFHGEALALDYPRLADFRTLATRLDPTGKFRNPFLDRHVFGG
ncbi:FAD-binding protein [Amycolatopsis rhabdoformis]|uniref:FAD-binding protein n=1 Tax=Amycolatopsis rhabdoformis TaxID=1448059 RepID=A0ABZ1IBB8_9PSEU|nr:FAD-binding protein [Amycolatopsis rhabdoformis]WSE31715.1 FAD-binding protein [Amycolatopsis rhabdoformis]